MSVSWRRCLSRWWGFVPWRDGPGVFVGVHFAAILNHVVGLAYPVSDVVNGLGRCDGSSPRETPADELVLILAGLLAFTVADTSFAHLTAGGTYGAGNALDTGWVLGFPDRHRRLVGAPQRADEAILVYQGGG
jgi:hypothetical protein